MGIVGLKKKKKGKTDHDSKICLFKNDPLYIEII